jgi:hypothetical protein
LSITDVRKAEIWSIEIDNREVDDEMEVTVKLTVVDDRPI